MLMLLMSMPLLLQISIDLSFMKISPASLDFLQRKRAHYRFHIVAETYFYDWLVGLAMANPH